MSGQTWSNPEFRNAVATEVLSEFGLEKCIGCPTAESNAVAIYNYRAGIQLVNKMNNDCRVLAEEISEKKGMHPDLVELQIRSKQEHNPADQDQKLLEAMNALNDTSNDCRGWDTSLPKLGDQDSVMRCRSWGSKWPYWLNKICDAVFIR